VNAGAALRDRGTNVRARAAGQHIELKANWAIA